MSDINLAHQPWFEQPWPKLRRAWVTQLATLTYPCDPTLAVKTFLHFLPMLADLPDAAFTLGSLREVADSKRKMALGSYDEISRPLRAWWRRNRPLPTAIAAPRIPDRVPLSDEEMAGIHAAVREAVAICEEQASIRAARFPKIVYKSKPLTDEQLLAICEHAAARGDQLSAMRAAGLRLKIARVTSANEGPN